MHKSKMVLALISFYAITSALSLAQVQGSGGNHSGDIISTRTRPAEPDAPGAGSLVLRAGTQAEVPRLMKFSGVLIDPAGKFVSGSVDVTFSLYNTEVGGTALWFETQNVQADATGRYTALLGAMHTEGLPVELFTSGEVRWLGIQIGLEPEQQPRVLLVSVPYALKAGDAETLGGKPASAYMLSDSQSASSTTNVSASPSSGASQTSSGGKNSNAHTTKNSALTTCAAVTSDGAATANSIALFTTACNLESSVISQNTGHVGIGTTNPGALLGLSGTSTTDGDARYNVYSFDTTSATAGSGGGIGFAGYYSGTSLSAGLSSIKGIKENSTQGDYAGALVFDTRNNGGALTERLRISSAGNVGIGTSSPASLLHILNGSLRLQRGGSYGAVLDQSLGSIFTITNGAGKQMAFDYNGNLGLGTTSPLAMLHIMNGSLRLQRGGSYGAILDQSAGSVFTITNGVGKKLAFDYNGNLGIGTTTPGAMLEVTGTAKFDGAVSFASSQSLLGTVTIATPATTGSPAAALSVQATDLGTANYGVYALSSGAGGTGVYGEADNGAAAFGVWGRSTSGQAGHFDGNVDVVGNLSKSGGSFKIDHPLDPANKYLYHSFVESPDMKNIYDGVVTLDENGEAVVQLPDWFQALNKDFRYQLTCVGGYAPVYIADEIVQNRFRIAGGRAGLKVSWQVTGVRQDAWANTHRIPVEEAKPAQERGYYLHPELFGAPEQKGINWANRPEQMLRLHPVNETQPE